MHWVIQNNIFNERGMQELLNILCRERYTFSTHRVIPFIGDIEPDINPEGKVICIGSGSMRHLAKKKGWIPGVWDLNDITFEMQKNAWGKHLLNYDAVRCELRDANPQWDTFFIRPEEDTKAFAGTVFNQAEFNVWKIQVSLSDSYEEEGLVFDKPADRRKIFGSTPVIMNRVINIHKEYRFWIVNGEIATFSQYKNGCKVEYLGAAPPEIVEFVEFRVRQWQPHDAFVIDVAETDDGHKIVEINTINSCGFYAANLENLVYALGNM